MNLKYIDSIRGIAVLMVILVHVGAKISGLNYLTHWIYDYGQMGVQLFFVASAYTLCLSASNRAHETEKLKKYSIRRFFRIAPLYYAGIIWYFLVSTILSIYEKGYISIPIHYTFENVTSNVLFIHGFYEPANNNIVPGGWSIGTEMAFYVIFPLAYFIAKKYFNKSVMHTVLWIFLGFLVSQIVLRILVYYGLSIENNGFLYYNLTNQLPVFVIGIGYYFMNSEKKLTHNWIIDFVVFILLTVLAIYVWHKTRMDYKFSIIPFVSGLSFIFLIEVFRKLDFLNQKFLIKMGKVSFSMYIIHFTLIEIITDQVNAKLANFLSSEFILILFFILITIATFLIALLTEKYIEKPFIKLGKRIILKMNKDDNA